MTEQTASRRRREADDLGGLPKNFMRACLLLLVGEQPSHGYDLIERLNEFGLNSADPGGLYRVLRAMEQEGLMRSGWETSDVGPARRTYHLTEEGNEWLHAWAGTLRVTARIVGRYIKRYDALLKDDAPARRA